MLSNYIFEGKKMEIGAGNGINTSIIRPSFPRFLLISFILMSSSLPFSLRLSQDQLFPPQCRKKSKIYWLAPLACLNTSKPHCNASWLQGTPRFYKEDHPHELIHDFVDWRGDHAAAGLPNLTKSLSHTQYSQHWHNSFSLTEQLWDTHHLCK